MAGKNLPPPQSPFVDALLNLSYDGYQYLLSLLNLASLAVITVTTAPNLTATGTTQATALVLSSSWNQFATVPAGSGALLEAMQDGQTQTVFNNGANSLKVYPPPGMSIDALPVNTPYVLGVGMMQIFNFINGSIKTTQLQIP